MSVCRTRPRRGQRIVTLAWLALGCAMGERPVPAAAAAPTAPEGAKGPRVVGEVVFRGACDASGAVPLSARRFVVADDEDNILRTYDADVGGEPLFQTDVSSALGLPVKGKKKRRAAELDLEAATRLGDRAYWLTSHGRNKKGKLEPARLRLFATSLGQGDHMAVVGRPYERLAEDLVNAPTLARFDLAKAARRAPKAEGGLNLEGFTAGPDGEVWLAFRNPVPEGRALLVRLLNLPELVAEFGQGPAKLASPVLLDLGGRGVRALSWWRGRYLIIAGGPIGGGVSALYTWNGKTGSQAVTARLEGIDLGGYNPEGFFTPEERDELLLLSDDGERTIDGEPCKRLDDPAEKRFRGLRLRLP